MAVVLIVQEGKQPVPNANTYASLAAANQYHEDRGNAEWSGFSDEQKSIALVNATDFISSEFKFRGRKLYGEADLARPQFLPFPRADLWDSAGRWIEDTPDGVVRACIELAVYAAKGTLYPHEAETLKPTGLVTEVRKKIGPLDTTYKYASATQLRQTPKYKKIVRWLNAYTWSGGRVYR